MIKPLKAKAFSKKSLNKKEELLSQARTLVTRDLLVEAGDLYRSVLNLDPQSLEALHILGSIEFHCKNYLLAFDCLAKATSLQPTNIELLLLFGKCAKELKKYDFAESALKQVLISNPKVLEANVEIGLLYFLKGELDLAIYYLKNALEINSNYYDAWNNLGVVLKEKREFEQALQSYHQAISLDADNPNAYGNRGVLLHMLGHFDDALLDIRRSIELNPGQASNHLSLGQLLLTLGQYSQGWEEFEWRWQYLRDNGVNTSKYDQFPIWTGRESLVGKKILIYAEQGLGDTLQFCRYVSLVAQLGGEVTLECEEPLIELLRNLDGVYRLIVQSDSLFVSDFDFQCPMMSLPRVFRTTLDSIPNAVPYLSATASKVSSWAHRLGPKTLPRVGLVWSGGLRPGQPELWAVNKRRNIALSALKSLAGIPIDFYSLQKGSQAEEELANLIAQEWGGPMLFNYVQDLYDFSDTAALIANLDLVISVDTSTAHLSAALGKPTWILNRFDTCWRWLLEREDSPWYPSVKVFRQPSIGEWGPVIDQIKLDLLQIYCK